ncbi:MAG: hypothetical protein DA330_09690 [Nitrososphaera sp.]|nr:hypothetical protein [Nitrososphaera sp.]
MRVQLPDDTFALRPQSSNIIDSATAVLFTKGQQDRVYGKQARSGGVYNILDGRTGCIQV